MLTPPRGLITAAVNFSMVTSAERDGELVADLAPECPKLGKANMVRIRRLSSTDQAGLRRDELRVLFVANTARLGEGQDPLVDASQK